MPSSKSLLIFLYLIILTLPVITWVRNQAWEEDVVYSGVRLAGMLAFTLINLQVAIGSLMPKLRPVFGPAILKLHIVQGTVAFVLAWIHPTLLVVGFGLDTVVRLTGFAIWGKWGLVLLNLSVVAGYLRTQRWLAKYWRWVHRLNYLTLAVVYFHSWNLGSDVKTFPMLIIYYLSPLILGYGLYTKIRGWYITAYGNYGHIR